MAREALKPPPRKKMEAQIKRLKRFKAERDQAQVRGALDALARAAESKNENVYEKDRRSDLRRRHARRDLRQAAPGLRLRTAVDRGLTKRSPVNPAEREWPGLRSQAPHRCDLWVPDISSRVPDDGWQHRNRVAAC